MSRVNFCLVTPFEAEQIRRGENISCRNHRHIPYREVLKLVDGGKARYWLEENKELLKKEQITFNYNSIAEWAVLPDGKKSERHVVLRHAREWRTKNGAVQWVPIGGRGRTTGNRTKIHLKAPRAPKCKVIVRSDSPQQARIDI